SAWGRIVYSGHQPGGASTGGPAPSSGFAFRLLLGALWCGRRLGTTLDADQPARREAIDARPIAAGVGHHHGATAARIGRDVDVVRRSGPLHHVAFAHVERDSGAD